MKIFYLSILMPLSPLALFAQYIAVAKIAFSNAAANVLKDSPGALLANVGKKIKPGGCNRVLNYAGMMLNLGAGNFRDTKNDMNKIIELKDGDTDEALSLAYQSDSCIGYVDCDSFAKSKSLGCETDWANYRKFYTNI